MKCLWKRCDGENERKTVAKTHSIANSTTCAIILFFAYICQQKDFIDCVCLSTFFLFSSFLTKCAHQMMVKADLFWRALMKAIEFLDFIVQNEL